MKTHLIFIFTIALFTSVSLVQKGNSFINISDVQIKNSWIIVFDSNGKKISQMPKLKNEIVGITGNFFVVTSNDWIINNDKKCKEKSRRQIK